MQSFIIRLLTCSITMSLLALFYMMLTPLLARRYSVKWRYYAWLVIVIGLIIPFRPQFNNAIVKIDVPNETSSPIIQIGNRTPITVSTIIENVTPTSALPIVSWWHAVVLVWLVGMFAFLVYHGIRHYHFIKMARRWSEKIADEQTLALLQCIKSEMGISKQINAYLCSSIGSPMMIGYMDPKILFPKADLSQDELCYIFKHELVHFKRKDLWYKTLVLIATALHWFNPILHLMVKAIDIQCELSCDAEVVRNADVDTRQHYSETIIGVIKYQSKFLTALSTSFSGGKKGMKKRIFSIMDSGKKKTGIAIVCCIIILAMSTGIAFSATSTVSHANNGSDSSHYEENLNLPDSQIEAIDLTDIDIGRKADNLSEELGIPVHGLPDSQVKAIDPSDIDIRRKADQLSEEPGIPEYE